MKRFLLLTLLLLTPTALGATYYVDNSCLNNGNGLTDGCASTVGGAGATTDLQSLFFNAVADDIVLIKNGTGVYVTTYAENDYWHSGFLLKHSGTAGHPITFKNYPGHSPLLANCPLSQTTWCQNTVKGGDAGQLTIAITDQAYAVFDGLRVRGTVALTSSNHIIVQNCEIYEGQAGQGDGNWAALHLGGSDFNTFKNNYMHDVVLLTNSGQQSSAACIKVYTSQDNLFEYNTCKRVAVPETQAGGVDDKDSGVRNEYRYNWIEDVRTCFRLNNQATRNPINGLLIHHNVCASNNDTSYSMGVRSLGGSPGTGFRIYNNTIWNTDERGLIDSSIDTDYRFWNNIVISRRSSTNPNSAVYYSSAATALSDYNGFHPNAKDWVYDGSRYTTLAAYQSASGKDAHSLNVDCQVVNAPFPYSPSTTYDFHLVPGSPCRGAGRVGGVSSGAPTDMGAYADGINCVGYGCATPPAPIGTDYYVRTDGNDVTCGGLADASRASAAAAQTSCTDTNGDGTIQAGEVCTACAFRTVGKCATTVAAPGRCNITPGTYTESNIVQANAGALVNSSLRTDCTCTAGSTTVTCGGTIPTAQFGQFVKCATGPYFSWSRVLSNNGTSLTLSEPYRGDTSSAPGTDTLALANFIEIKGTGPARSSALITSWVDKPSDVAFTFEAGSSCVYSYLKGSTTDATWAAPQGFRDKNTTWDTWRLNSNGRDAYIGLQNSSCPCTPGSGAIGQLDELPGTWVDGVCASGINSGKTCLADGECSGSTCSRAKALVRTRRVCTGGTMAGYSCLGDADCLGGGTCGGCQNPSSLTMQAAMSGYLFTSNKDYTIVDNLTFERGGYMRPDEAKVDQQAARLGGNHARYSNLDILTGQLGIVPQTGFSGAATSATLYSGIRALDSTWCTMGATKLWSGLKFYNVEMRGGVGNLMQCDGVRGVSTTDRVIFDRIYAHRNFTGILTNTTGCGAGNAAEWDCSTHYWAASGERQYRGNHGIYNLTTDPTPGQYADHIMFRNSIIDETSDGVQFGGGGNATDIWFINNTFGAYENANLSHRLQAIFGCTPVTGGGCATNAGGSAKLYNNLFYQKQAGYFSGPWINRGTQTDPTLIVSDYNYFLEPNLNATPGEDRVWTFSSPSETLSYVRSTYSQETHSILGCGSNCASRGWGTGYYDLAGVSGLTDVTVRDGTPTNYTPLTGFKGIDAGNVTYGTYEDFYGNVRSGTPDIGAVEYLGTAQTCGNNVREGTELCDGTDLGGNSCTTIGGGFTGGTLACNPTCNGWNTSGCTGAAANPRSGLSGAKLSGGSIK